jgi:hypothetical protein
MEKEWHTVRQPNLKKKKKNLLQGREKQEPMMGMRGGGRDCFVVVSYDFEYSTEDGKRVWMKEGEVLLLLAKTNNDWWQVSHQHICGSDQCCVSGAILLENFSNKKNFCVQNFTSLNSPLLF